jgi:hypothetical protein
MSQLVLVDECGNKWDCILLSGFVQYKHFKIEGWWKWFVAAARKFDEGIRVMLGAPIDGSDEVIYFTILDY